MSTFVQWSRATGPPVEIGATRITPEARILRLRLPFGGLVLNHPTAVLLESLGEHQKRLPIRDVSGMAQVAVALLPVAVWLLARLVLFARKEHAHD